MTESGLRVAGVSKHYGAVQALTDADLAVEAGSILGLVGPNGSGKSTLLGVIAGRVRPDTGVVIIDGEQHPGFSTPLAARHVGIELMPQEIAIVDSLSVQGNVCLGDEPSRRGVVNRREMRHSTVEALALVGLHLPVDRLAVDLTAAEKRMLMLARTLHRRARVIIIDEPTAGLAPEDARRVGDAVRRVRDAGTAVIYVSHYLDEVAGLADNAVGLRDGRVVVRLGRGEVSKQTLLEVFAGSAEPESAAGPETEAAARSDEVVLQVGPLLRGRTRDCSFEVRRGEIVGLAGLLGSGRSTIVNNVTGTNAHPDGPVLVNGHPVTSTTSALAAGLGHLSGDRSKCIIPSLDLYGHVSLPVLKRFRSGGLLSRAKERAGARQALSDAGVQTKVSYIDQLSGGNQQRALLARWLLADVDILVVDEPTVGVDVRARELILGQLQRFGRRKALLVSSSEPEELVAIADRVLCFRDGKQVAEARGADLTVNFITAAIT